MEKMEHLKNNLEGGPMKELSKLNKAFITVIIPVSNTRFLRESVLSMARQTKLPDEIILVYNGVEQPMKFDLFPIDVKYIHRKEKIGPSAARNLAIKASKGNVLFFQDADDIAYPNRIALSVAALLDGRWGMVFGNVDLCDAEGKLYKKNDIKEKYSYELLKDHNIVPSASVAVRKEVFQEVELFNEDLLVAEDYDLWLRIAKKYELLQLNAALYQYRDWGQSHSKEMRHLYPEAEKKIKEENQADV